MEMLIGMQTVKSDLGDFDGKPALHWYLAWSYVHSVKKCVHFSPCTENLQQNEIQLVKSSFKEKIKIVQCPGYHRGNESCF